MLRYESSGRVTGTIRRYSGRGNQAIEPVDVEAVREQWADDPAGLDRTIAALQLAAYVMIGGGMLGEFAACQPGQFYIDARVSGLKASKASIYNAVAVLALHAAAGGYDIDGFGKDGAKPLKRPSLPYAGWILDA